MTADTLSHLKHLGLEYHYIDVDRDKAASAWVRAQSHGKEKKPTLDIDGTILVEPDNDELDDVLRKQRLIEAD
jgi:glutaredoxin